ncbi:MAG: metalloregulator ArsR/SmtB family transcription factor [bacterium]
MMEKDFSLLSINFDDYAEKIKALAHPTRLKIVAGLSMKNECNVTKMAECLNIPQPTVSQHLNILKNAGIIEGFRHGNQICYKVVDDFARQAVSLLK